MTTLRKKSISNLLKVPKLNLPRSGGKWPDPSCYVGVEIEAEGLSYVADGKPASLNNVSGILQDAGWDIATDGSLRNDGREFKFSAPLLGLDLRRALDVFYEHVRFEESPRAGIHIHVDWTVVEDADSVNTLLAILYCIEPAMFEMIGRGRKDCVYCKPLVAATTEELLKMFTTNFETAASTFLEGAITRRTTDLRYFGANLISLSKFGTVEFRYFPSICDKAKMEEWLYLVQLLRLCAVESKLTPVEVFRLMSTPAGVYDFINKWFSYSNIAELLLKNIDIESVTESARVMALLCECERVKTPSGSRHKMSKSMERLVDNKYPEVRRRMEARNALAAAVSGNPDNTRNIIDLLINEQNG